MGTPLIDSMGLEELHEFSRSYRRPSKEAANGIVRRKDNIEIVATLSLYARERASALTDPGRAGKAAAKRAEAIYRKLPAEVQWRSFTTAKPVT